MNSSFRPCAVLVPAALVLLASSGATVLRALPSSSATTPGVLTGERALELVTKGVASDERDGTPSCCRTASSRAALLIAASPAPAASRAGNPFASVDEEAVAPSRAENAPPGMVWIPGGEFTMGGVGPEVQPEELPLHRVRVDGFWMDETEVTVGAFAKFVAATGYVTIAEKKPDWEELKAQVPPGTPKPDDEWLVAGSMVFQSTAGPVPLDDWQRWWSWVPGASWKQPLGPSSSAASDALRDDHPVVHVAWDDAVAYCAWAGKRLPTEAEWEFACRGGAEKQRFAWGDDPPGDDHKANLWQGRFPYAPKSGDRFLLTAPVESFPPNAYGLYDMIGNVWEWCSDWYRADTYETDAKQAGKDGATSNPRGPATSFDSADPHTPKRVNRGGSFLCNAEYCASYRPSARMRTSSDTGQNHLGFRAVMSSAPKDAPAERR
jgi:formylglycine-generating enzyme required for sulfatase activity